MLPLVPVMVTGVGSALTKAPSTVTVNWDEPVPLIVLGLRLVVTPFNKKAAAVKVTGESNPSAAMRLIVVVPVVVVPVPLPTASTFIGFGEATNPKEGVGTGATGM
jgi:hypothetical protein